MGEPINIVVVDDYAPWRSFVLSTLTGHPGLRIIAQASDGMEVVQKAFDLQPDLILLDIGLPTLNGIEVARRIRTSCSASIILFVSNNRSPDIVKAALQAGGGGYVAKPDAAGELLPAIRAVLEGKVYVSASFVGHEFRPFVNDEIVEIKHCHEVAFYADDAAVVDGYARFIETSLDRGHAVISAVNESHRKSLLSRLEADGVNVPAAIETGHYVLLDARDTLSRLAVNDMPDSARCVQVIGDLIREASKTVSGASSRVAVCGEIAPVLLSKGNWRGAVELEHIWDEIAKGYGVHTLCGYLLNAFPGGETSGIFQRICGEHSAVCSQ